MSTFDEILSAMLILARINEHLEGQHDQSTHGHGDGGGSKTGGGKLKSANAKAIVNTRGTSMKVEDSKVSGTVIIETSEDFDTDSVDDSDITDYISSDDTVLSLPSNAASAVAGNIAGVKVGNVKRGKGYLAIDVTYELNTPLSEMEGGDSYGSLGFSKSMLGLD